MLQLAWFLGVAPGGTLPAMRYFVPRPQFTQYMAANYKGKLLYDIGAGVGHVARALADSGLDVIALDMYRREEEQFSITLANGTSYEYEAGSIVMLCRPSHDGYVRAVIQTALSRGVQEIVYVGLPKNTALDLGAYRHKFRRVLRNVGAAGENVYQMTIARREPR
jgi:uncharacterized UPF0146 family protein